MAGKSVCRVALPPLRVFEVAVSMLAKRYPVDPIEWKGGGRRQAEQAIAAAKWAFQFSKGRPCHERKLAAAATLFYEIIMLHPLIDGNKRLATLMLDAFLLKNRLPRPRKIYQAALRVAGREWSREDVYRWLLRVYRAKRPSGGGRGE